MKDQTIQPNTLLSSQTCKRSWQTPTIEVISKNNVESGTYSVREGGFQSHGGGITSQSGSGNHS